MGPAAQSGEPTYVLSDFDVQYPYIDRTPKVLGGIEDIGRAGVRYTTSWAGRDYPGVATCRVEAHDSSGNLMGSFVGDVESLVPVAKGEAWTPLEATEMPSTITAECEAGRLPGPGAGYEFTAPEIVRGELGSLQLVADVSWKTEESPGTASCSAGLRTSAGGFKTLDFTLSAPQGRLTVVLIPESLEGASVEDLTCVPFVER